MLLWKKNESSLPNSTRPKADFGRFRSPEAIEEFLTQFEMNARDMPADESGSRPDKIGKSLLYWSINNKNHRLGGPAVVWRNGNELYYLDGLCLGSGIAGKVRLNEIRRNMGMLLLSYTEFEKREIDDAPVVKQTIQR